MARREKIGGVPFDLRPLARRLEKANANLNCLCCGSSDVSYDADRYALIQLGSDGRLAVESDWGLVAGVFCGVRVCKACGYVHLHSLTAIERQERPL